MDELPYGQPITKELSIVNSVIKRAYSTTTETGHLVDSRRLMGWVDELVFRNVDITNKEWYASARQFSEHLLLFIQSWREAIYVPEVTGGYANLSLSLELGRSHILEDIVPIIIPLDPVVLMYIDDNDTTGAKMYNDIKARGLALLVYSALQAQTIVLRHLRLGPRGGFDIHQTEVYESDHERTNKMLTEIAELIDKNIDYPSVTQQCSHCLFSGRCRI